MNWYIGQPIVAIKDSNCGKIKKGQEFIIKGLMSTFCKCKIMHIDVGLEADMGRIQCLTCMTKWKSRILWKREELFAPLDQDISELTEILENPIFKPFELKTLE